MQFLRLFINTEKCKNITFLLQDVVNFFTNVCYNFVQIREAFYEKIIYMFLTAILVIVSLFSAVGCKDGQESSENQKYDVTIKVKNTLLSLIHI